MPNGIFKDFNKQSAHRKADKLQAKYPDLAVFVIYDYEEQRFDAVTEEALAELYMMDWDFTIVHEH
jgi:hypothetical protein